MLLLVLSALLAADALADEPTPDKNEQNIPGSIHGQLGDPIPRAGFWRWTGRVLLFVPRVASEAALLPPRGLLYVLDRTNTTPKILSMFKGQSWFVLAPRIVVRRGYDASFGAAVGVLSPFGKGFLAELSGLFGGEYKQKVALRFSSGEVFGDVLSLDARGDIQRLSDSFFFGIGNRDKVDFVPGSAPINALQDSTSIESRFDQTVLLGELGLNLVPKEGWELRLSTSYAAREFGPSQDEDNVPLEEAYDVDVLPGYEHFSRSYFELALKLDTLRQPDPFVSDAFPSTGSKLVAYAGRGIGLGEDVSDYWRFGFDYVQLVNLYRHTRVLVLRFGMEAVPSALENINFLDLPRLGSSRLMRGFPHGRLRDRFAAYATIEYRYPVSSTLSMFVFLDAGQVGRNLGDLGAKRFHYTTGLGFEMFSRSAFLFRVQTAYTPSEGGALIFSLSPSVRVKRRTQRL